MIRRADRSASDPWERVLRQALEDPRISYEATGVLVSLLAKPDGWKIQRKHIQEARAEFGKGLSQDRTQRVLNELKEAGYLVIERERTASGRLGDSDWILQEDAPGCPKNYRKSAENTPKSSGREIQRQGNPAAGEPPPVVNDSVLGDYSALEDATMRDAGNDTQYPVPDGEPSSNGMAAASDEAGQGTIVGGIPPLGGKAPTPPTPPAPDKWYPFYRQAASDLSMPSVYVTKGKNKGKVHAVLGRLAKVAGDHTGGSMTGSCALWEWYVNEQSESENQYDRRFAERKGSLVESFDGWVKWGIGGKRALAAVMEMVEIQGRQPSMTQAPS